MEVITIVYDYCAGNEGADSILALPLGTGTVLDRLHSVVSGLGSKEILVRSQREEPIKGLRRAEQSTGSAFQLLSPEDLNERIRSLESSDLLLIIDPRYWPADNEDFRPAFEAARGYPGAVHAVTIGADATGSVERVQCDSNGRVQRIRRLYNRVTKVEPQAGVVAFSLVPVAAVGSLKVSSLNDLRLALSTNGVLSRDIPLHSDLIDLTKQRGYLALNERVVTSSIHSNPPPAYSRLTSDVLVGRGAMVHETARLIGPVILQPGATVERDATIIGPCLIASGATVRQGAVVAQSIVPFQATVESNASVRHSVAPIFVEEAAIQGARNDNDFEDGEFGEPISPAVEDATPVRQSKYAGLKRALDVTLSIVLLILLAPLFAIVAIFIKLNSPGSIFFVHEREGRNGRRFPCIKFRTMYQDAHSMQRQLYKKSMVDGPHFKLKNDPRQTRIGRILRRTNIDELPQIFNVLAGHMSLIGPRPSPFRENQYCVPWRRARLSVRPGITGLWQICRSYGSDSDFQQWIYYDILYVRHMSLWLDCKIFMATIFSLVADMSIPIGWLIRSERNAFRAANAPLNARAIAHQEALDRGSVFI